MNNRFAPSEGQQLLQLYGLMAKEAFTAIRYLSAGRSSLYHENLNPALDHFSDDQLRENMTLLGSCRKRCTICLFMQTTATTVHVRCAVSNGS